MGTTFLDLLTAKVALELRAIDVASARTSLGELDRAYSGRGLIGLFEQRGGIGSDQLQQISHCAQQCYFLKEENTYKRVLTQHQQVNPEQIRQLMLQASQESKRLGQILVEANLLSPVQDEQLLHHSKQVLQQEEQAAVGSLRQVGYQGIEQSSRMISAVVQQLAPSQNLAEGTQILPQEIASGQLPANQVQLGTSSSGFAATAELAVPAGLPPELAGTGLEERYAIEQKLGEGGMGAVYLAYSLDDAERATPLALKVVRAGVVDAEKFQEAAARFKREILATSFCAHENVIEIHDASETDDGSYYMAMEYIEGEQLDELIKREGPVPIPRLVDMLDDVLQALEAIHAANIVHRDIKPQNFRVWRQKDGTERVKIMDFGIARVLDAEDSGQGEQFFRTIGGRITGSPAYLSPESITEPDSVGPQSDLYSLGISIFRIAAGRLPFVAKAPTEYLPLHLYKKPPSLAEAVPGTPPALEALYDNLLEKIAKNRTASAREALNWLNSKVRPELGLPPRGGATPPPAPEPMPQLAAPAPLPELPQLPTPQPLPGVPATPVKRGRSSDRFVARPQLAADSAKGGGALRVLLFVALALVLAGAGLVALHFSGVITVPGLPN